MMSITGSKGYCEYCRAIEDKKELSIDSKSLKLMCKECQAEINRFEELITTLEKRLTPTLKKYLVKTCFERSRTNPHDERYKESTLFVTKDKRNILRKLIGTWGRIFEITKTPPGNFVTSPTFYFGYSEVELLVIQAKKERSTQNYNVSVIGRIELSELCEILR